MAWVAQGWQVAAGREGGVSSARRVVPYSPARLRTHVTDPDRPLNRGRRLLRWTSIAL